MMEEDSSGDDEILYDLFRRMRKQRTIRARPNFMNMYDDGEFCARFRLRKDTVLFLLDLIHDNIANRTDRNNALSPLDQLLLTLRFYASGAFLICIGDFCGVDKATASRVVKKVSNAIATLASRFIQLPRTDDELKRVQQQFYRIAAFPRVIGAIDCTHVKIKSPGGGQAEEYRGRDGTFSFTVQTVCSADLKIMNIVSRWPGAAHDQTVFNNSSLRGRFEQGEFGNKVLVGDSGYGVRNYLLTPLPNPVTPAQNLYNESLIRTRNTVERSYGVWKRRFPVLSQKIKVKLNCVEAVIVACAVLHNIAIDMKEDVPPLDADTQRAIDAAIIAEQQEEAHDIQIQNNATRDSFVEYFNSLL